MRQKGRGGAARPRREGGEWVGGRTGGATRNSYQLIIIEQGEEKKRAGRRARKTGMLFGGWQLRAETSDMTPGDC